VAPSFEPLDETSQCIDSDLTSAVAIHAAIKLQKVLRGRRARKRHFFGVGDYISSLGARTQNAVASAKSSALGMLIGRCDRKLQATYTHTMKPRLAPCPAMPRHVRALHHLLGDYAWRNVHESLMHSLSNVLAERVMGPPPATPPSVQKQIRKRAYRSIHWDTWTAAAPLGRLRMVLMHLRAKFLYAYFPYDQTIWIKLGGSYDVLLVMVLQLLPFGPLRSCFYSTLLLCLTLPWADATSYQYMQLVLVFKGSQFFSGIILGLSMMFHLWRCLVLDSAHACGAASEARIQSTIEDKIGGLLYSQGIVALALYLSHRTTSAFDPRVLLARQRLMLEEMWTRWVLGLEAAHRRASEESLMEPFLDVYFAGVMPSSYATGELEAARPPVSMGKLPLAVCGCFGRAERAATSCWLAFQTRVRSLGCVDRMVVRAQATARSRRWGDLEKDEDDPDDQDDEKLHFDLFTSIFFWLLLWDASCCFVFVTTLFGTIHGSGVGWGWRAAESFEVLRVAFMLSAWPFVPIYIGAKLGASAGMGPSTGFNRHGMCVPVNTTGLSAYCIWVRRLLRRSDVRQLLAATDVKHIAAEASRLLAYTEAFPFAVEEQGKRKAELHALLDSTLVAALAAKGYPDPLVHRVYRACFPNECMITSSERRHAKHHAEERAKRTREFTEGLRRRV